MGIVSHNRYFLLITEDTFAWAWASIMAVELDHLGCDITELGEHFLPKYLHYISGGKTWKGPQWHFSLYRMKKKKKSQEKTFFSGHTLPRTTIRNSPSSSEMPTLFFFKNYLDVKFCLFAFGVFLFCFVLNQEKETKALKIDPTYQAFEKSI